MLNLLEDVRADSVLLHLRHAPDNVNLSVTRQDAVTLGEALLAGRRATVGVQQGGDLTAETGGDQLRLTWHAEAARRCVLWSDDLPLHRLIVAGALCQGQPNGKVWVAPGARSTRVGSGVNLLTLQVGTADLLAVSTPDQRTGAVRGARWITVGGLPRLQVQATHHAYRQRGLVQFTGDQVRRLRWRLREAADDVPVTQLSAAERAAEAEVHERLLRICSHDPARTRVLPLVSARQCQRLALSAHAALRLEAGQGGD